jgi:hypothetical protein
MTSIKFLDNFLFIAVAAGLTCNTTDPLVDKTELLLKLEDVSCTEAWIQLTTNNIQLPAEINLTRTDADGNSVSHISILNTQDSLLYIDSLLPNQTYLLKAASTEYGVLSSEISVTTMDTTSHNFTFETWTFGGDAGSSSLYDVAIIDENNIWAVGEIYVADTSVNGYTTYNAAHWDGNEWTLHRIMFYTICGQQNLSSYPARAIFAFNENEIFIGGGGRQLAKISGIKQIETICLPFSMVINKIWGMSSSDLYVVGNNGSIAHYNGSQWTRIESGTSLNINDVWGEYNEKTGEWEILAVASNKFFNEGNTLLKIDGLTSTKLNTTGLPWSLSSVWFKAGKKYFVGGDGFFFKKLLNEIWEKDSMFIPIYKDRIRGVNINDIIVSGSNGLLSHFNGINWKHYIDNELPFFSGRFLSCDLNNNTTVAVGWKETQSIITIGIR